MKFLIKLDSKQNALYILKNSPNIAIPPLEKTTLMSFSSIIFKQMQRKKMLKCDMNIY